MSSESGRKSHGTNGHSAHNVDPSSSNTANGPSDSPKAELPEKQKPPPLPRPTRDGISSTLTKHGQVLHAPRRPGPAQGNGNASYGLENARPRFRMDLKSIRPKDVKTLVAMVKSKFKGEQLVDDKTMIMERVIQLVANLPHRSRLRDELTNKFLSELWNTLDHPPLLYVGDKFKYRMADGSWNNPMNPTLGAAGSTYARSCRPGIVPLGALPDPGLVFDTVMCRTNYRKHPNNVSSILWYWATIVIHDLFWTDHMDDNKTKTSSYLDLSPLYGSNQEMQDSIRTFKDGLMKPDTYADKRLMGMAPGVSVLLIMFNRFHNFVATNLAAINEGGRFTRPSPGLDEQKAAAAWKKYDNDLFQTARLVTSGMYINIVLVDYVRNIINLNRSNSTWTLDPRVEMGKDVGTYPGSERGAGSMVSAEFNLAYRWHSCISDRDDKWIQGFYHELFDGKDPTTLTPGEMMRGFMKFDGKYQGDPGQWTFGGYKRRPDGRFEDDDLVDCIASAIEDCAGAFGGRNVPKAMRPVEILGILQGRKWNVAGLNEFRKHFGLKPYEKFEDINSDPEIADSLRHLYEHPDFVELYPGLVAEEAKDPMVPGVGIAPTYTISRVILSDAVCLTRGDRHYTTDYHPRSLTSWGFNEVQYDLNVNQGCVFYKLFLRAFPNHFKRNSIYAHYPMCIPSETKRIMTNLGRLDDFDYERPAFIPERINVTTYGGAMQVLESQTKYRVSWDEAFGFLMGDGGRRFMMAGDAAVHAEQRKCLHAQIYKGDWPGHVKRYYSNLMDRLMEEKRYKLAGNTYIDIIRDVGNIAPVYFISKMFNLPLETKENPKGVYTAEELYMVLSTIFTAVFVDIDPVKSYPLRQAAKDVATQLGQLIEANVKGVTGFGIRSLFGSPNKDDPLYEYGAELIKGLYKGGKTAGDITWSQILPAATAAVPTMAEAFAQAVDFYLSPAGYMHVRELYRVANSPSSEEMDKLLLGYCMEGIRLSGSWGTQRVANVDDVIQEDDGRQVSVKAHDRVFVGAAKDARHFPSPEEVNPHRPLGTYLHFGLGPHTCLGRDVANVALIEMFRSVFRRKNVRRAVGAQGELKKVLRPGGSYAYMREDRGAYYPFPCTMKICYDI